jgi:hypothetical protein
MTPFTFSAGQVFSQPTAATLNPASEATFQRAGTLRILLVTSLRLTFLSFSGHSRLPVTKS